MSPDDIVEVSDAAQLTTDIVDETPRHPEFRVLKGQPTDEELAALVAVLSSAAGPAPEPGPQALNLWGRPEDKLRYAVFSWQLVTLLERNKMRR
ncbi:MAG: acetyl-/propionyl-coenzyme carboxylase AccE5 [Mycobacterium sp.]|nr:acetyl-/propionyl-coenzyme carboxylase AccE5 [Mycobacterium sp.]